MGLTVRRKNERTLTVSHCKILTVNRKNHYPIVTLLTVSRKKAKILTVNRKSHYPLRPSYLRQLFMFLALRKCKNDCKILKITLVQIFVP